MSPAHPSPAPSPWCSRPTSRRTSSCSGSGPTRRCSRPAACTKTSVRSRRRRPRRRPTRCHDRARLLARRAQRGRDHHGDGAVHAHDSRRERRPRRARGRHHASRLVPPAARVGAGRRLGDRSGDERARRSRDVAGGRLRRRHLRARRATTCSVQVCAAPTITGGRPRCAMSRTRSVTSRSSSRTSTACTSPWASSRASARIPLDTCRSSPTR